MSEYHPLGAPQMPPEGTPEDRVLRWIWVAGRVRRSNLSEHTGLPDRTVRDAVRRLREAGWPICSSSHPDHGGFWLAATPEELLACAEEEYGTRIRSELHTRSAMRRAARRMRAEQEARTAPVQGVLV